MAQSNRTQVKDLEQARALQTYKPSELSPVALSANTSNSSLDQLTRSLANFNQNLMGYVATTQPQDNSEQLARGEAFAAENPESVRKSLQGKFRDAVKEGVLPEEANPFFVTGAYKRYGSEKAKTDYWNALNAREADIAKFEDPESIDKVIAEERQKFFDNVGDNFYVRDGAMGVMDGLESQFKAKAVQARGTRIKQEQERIWGSEAMRLAETFSTLSGDDAVKNIQMGIRKLDYDGYEMGIPQNRQKLATNLSIAAASIARVSPEHAIEFLAHARETVLDSGARLGGQPDVAQILDSAEEQVYAIEKRNETDEYRQRYQADEIVTRNAIRSATDSLMDNTKSIEAVVAEAPATARGVVESLVSSFRSAQDASPVAIKNTVARIDELLNNSQAPYAESVALAAVQSGQLDMETFRKTLKRIDFNNDLRKYRVSGDYTSYFQRSVSQFRDEALAKDNPLPIEVLNAIPTEQNWNNAFNQVANEWYSRNPQGDENAFRQALTAEDGIFSKATAMAQSMNMSVANQRANEIARTQALRDDIKKSQDAKLDYSDPWFTNRFTKVVKAAQTVETAVLKYYDKDMPKNVSSEISKMMAPNIQRAKEVASLYADALVAGKWRDNSMGQSLAEIITSDTGYVGFNTTLDDKQKMQVLEKYKSVKNFIGYSAEEIISGRTDDGIDISEFDINPFKVALFKDTSEMNSVLSDPEMSKELLSKVGIRDPERLRRAQSVILKTKLK